MKLIDGSQATCETCKQSFNTFGNEAKAFATHRMLSPHCKEQHELKMKRAIARYKEVIK